MSKIRVGILVSVIGIVSAFGQGDLVVADFEGSTYGAWTTPGSAFGAGPARGSIGDQNEVTGFSGTGLVNSFLGGDEPTGTLTSPPFKLERDHLSFLLGGGSIPDELGIELLVDGESVRSKTPSDDEMLTWRSWDVREFHGRSARIRIFDRASGGWGHVNVDHIVQTNRPRSTEPVGRLADYRKTDRYYRELYRPQYHFTPPINWMNDPNGLVYHRGEYHLFYQHNPHGNLWGHMSWGHAVSDDLVHWKHLPIALHEEYGVMIFSGCAVVDHRNTSGFGVDGEPAMVAIYTGHGHANQTQDLAFSNDRGRTWTKFEGNPVIDIREKDFRDPKVFWHEETKRWVMVVSLATAKVLRFYGSPDLKEWRLLSEFGPAGAKGKPNWECPDLFELPIEGNPSDTRWVLEVDMGNAAVAGGSGGEYFVGRFDGERFVSDYPLEEVRWVDYGRDFYAPVSYSDIPKADGRRIWIGWMNNWETHRVPTHPWRSAMSIPRSLTLRGTDEGLKLVQTPVEELAALRGGNTTISDLRVAEGRSNLKSYGISGLRLEMVAEIELGDATEVGFHVRKGDGESTIIGYDVGAKRLFIDRTRSGEVDFHPAFSGKHLGPLDSRNGRIKIRIFIDDSSVEVFGNDGVTVLTDRIFPSPDSDEVEAYAVGGTAVFRSLRVWPLDSIWR